MCCTIPCSAVITQMLNVSPPDLFTTWFLRVADTVIVILLVSFPLRLSSPKGVNIDMPNRHANTRQGVTRRWDMSTTNSSDQAREKKRLCRHRGLATYTHGDPAQHEQHSSQLAERTVGFLPQTQGRHGGEDKRKRVADRNGHGYVCRKRGKRRAPHRKTKAGEKGWVPRQELFRGGLGWGILKKETPKNDIFS